MQPASPFDRLLPRVLMRVLPVATVVLLVIGLVASILVEDAFLGQLKDRLARESDVGAQTVAAKLETLRSSVRAVATNDLVINGLVDVEARNAYVPIFFNGLQIAGPRGGALISFTDYRGRIIASNWKGAAYTKATWLSRVMEGHEHLQIRADGMILVVPVLYDGIPEGAVVVEYRREHVAQLLSFSPGAGAALVSADGKILFAKNPEFAALYREDPTASRGWIRSDVAVPGLPHLKAVVAEPSQTAFAAVHKIERFMFATIALALLALVAGIVLTGVLATRPLTRFISDIKDFGSAEDLGRQIEVTGAREFQDLAASFNSMLERLKTTVVSNESLARENTIRKAAERALMESERRYRDLIEGSPRGIYIYRDGELLFANPAFARLFGFASVRETLASTCLEALLGDDVCDGLERQLESSVAPGQTGFRTELRLLSGRSEAVWVEHHSMVIAWEGEPAILGNLTDISDRKRVERLKDEFVSVVSHELRTPLTSLVGSLGLVRSGTLGDLPAKAQELTDIAHRSAGRLVTLVNDILDVEKIEAGSMSFTFAPTEIVALARRAISETNAYGEKYGVRFRLNERLGQAHVRADEVRLTQALTNLLSNAAKFSPEGSQVVVRLTREGRSIRIAVADRGPGIPRDMHKKIFEKFTQIDTSDSRAKDGTGLGLSICKAIVEKHDGRMRIESEPGAGSTFSFALPEVNVVIDMGDYVAMEATAAPR